MSYFKYDNPFICIFLDNVLLFIGDKERKKIKILQKQIKIFVVLTLFFVGMTTFKNEVKALENGVVIDATNFPDETLRENIKIYDNNNDGVLSTDEISRVEYLFLESVENLKGVEVFKNISSLNISTSNSDELILEDFKKLGSLSIDKSGIRKLTVKNAEVLTELSVTFSGLQEINLSNLPEITRISLNGNEVSALDASNFNKLLILDISYNNFTTLDNVKLPANLQTVAITQVNDMSSIKLSTQESNSITNKIILQTAKTYDPATNTIAFPIKLPYNLKNEDFFDNLTFKNGRVVVDQKFRQNLNLFSRKNFNNTDISVNVIMEGLDKPTDTWTPITEEAFIRYEQYMRDNVQYDVIRGVIGSSGSQHFSNFFVDPNSKSLNSYSYRLGESTTSHTHYSFIDGSGHHFSFESAQPQKNEHFYKYIDGKLYLKSTYESGLLRFEELSYISDFGSVEHTLTVKNISNEKITDLKVMHELDTELNGFDYVPIISYGEKAVYIESPRFYMGIEALNNAELYVGEYNTPAGASKVEKKPRGTLIIDKKDTAVFYTTPLLMLAPNESYTMKFRENFYYKAEKPTFDFFVDAKDLSITVGDAWNVKDHFIVAKNESGEVVDYSNVTVETDANPNKVGEYTVTFKYNTAVKTVKLVVLNKEIQPETPKIEEPKQTEIIKKETPKVKPIIKTNDSSYGMMMLFGISILGLIAAKRKIK